MKDLYTGIDFAAAKEWGANTGNIDATFANFEAQAWEDTTFATILSAMREEDTFNTTKLLVQIADLIAEHKTREPIEKLNELRDYHIYLLDKNHSDLKDKEEMRAFIVKEFQKLSEKIAFRDREFIPTSRNDYSIKSNNKIISLKGFGEVFCAKFYKKLCGLRGVNIDLVNVSQAKNNIQIHESGSQEKIFEDMLNFFRREVQERLLWGKNLIIPGYIWWIEGGIWDTIWEWYSDATAALVAVVVQEALGANKRVLLEILKSVPGIMTTDPRLLRWTHMQAQVIEEMDFWIAKEVVGVRWAQAKLLNSYAMLPQVIRSWIDIRLRDPSDTHSTGTTISHSVESKKTWVEAVLWRKNVAIISMSSFSMNEGFIAKITEVVKKYASIDIIWTSETEFAFTVDMKEWITRDRVEAMIEELENNYLNKFGDKIVKTFHNGLLFCIGHNMKEAWIFAEAGAALRDKNINVELVSQGLMQRALVVWVANEDDVELWVQILHDRFQLSQ